jgi:hypothetical protein
MPAQKECSFASQPGTVFPIKSSARNVLLRELMMTFGGLVAAGVFAGTAVAALAVVVGVVVDSSRWSHSNRMDFFHRDNYHQKEGLSKKNAFYRFDQHRRAG